MDKIFSARVDEAIIQRIGLLARQLQTSKKAVIEHAILAYAEKVAKEQNFDVLEHTFGAWERDDTPQETVDKARNAFRESSFTLRYPH